MGDRPILTCKAIYHLYFAIDNISTWLLYSKSHRLFRYWALKCISDLHLIPLSAVHTCCTMSICVLYHPIPIFWNPFWTTITATITPWTMNHEQQQLNSTTDTTIKATRKVAWYSRHSMSMQLKPTNFNYESKYFYYSRFAPAPPALSSTTILVYCNAIIPSISTPTSALSALLSFGTRSPSNWFVNY